MRCFSLITRDDPGKKNKQTCKNVVTGANSSWLSPNFCYLFNNGIALHVFKVAKTNNSQFTARHPDLSLGQWRMFILLWYISAAKDYPTEIGNADLHNHLACPWVHENYHFSLNSMTYLYCDISTPGNSWWRSSTKNEIILVSIVIVHYSSGKLLKVRGE